MSNTAPVSVSRDKSTAVVIPASARSFIEVAADSDFPIQNLPFGVFQTAGSAARTGIAIGDQILDLAELADAGLLAIDGCPASVFRQDALNALISCGRPVWRAVRARVAALLDANNPELRDNAALRAKALVPQASATMLLPVTIGGYTDFYSSREHATNVGMMFRDPANALLPNWLHLPVGYNGRPSSVVVSSTDFHRPLGQVCPPGNTQPFFTPCRRLDFELETGFIVGRGNALGDPILVNDAEAHIFGMVILNDWSARDIQAWEYVPLGPFNSKGFATSISPWIVTLDALEPFRVAGPAQDPQPLPYLQQQGAGGFDITLNVDLSTEQGQSARICQSNFKYLYWSMAQQLAHHTIGGCNTRVGDLMGSGTISGPTKDSRGSLLELSWGGKEPLTIADGVTRSFLEDGDTVTMSGYAQGDGYRVGFGCVAGKVLPAKSFG